MRGMQHVETMLELPEFCLKTTKETVSISCKILNITRAELLPITWRNLFLYF